MAQLEAIAQEWGLTPMLVFNLNLVLEEPVTNTIFYGYSKESKHDQEIEIYIHLENNLLTLRITDTAQVFDPLQKDVPESLDKSIEEREIGGLGIHLVKNIMDELSYIRKDNQNILTLKKEL